MVSIDLKSASEFFSRALYSSYVGKAIESLQTVKQGNGAGNGFLGWVNLPVETDNGIFDRFDAIVNRWKGKVDVVVVVGIGGSYLGAKCAIEALSGAFDAQKKREYPQVLFAGHNICEDYIAELMDYLKDKEFAVVVISKSGTTTEPAIAFRLLKEALEKRIGREQASGRIVAITDASKGALRKLADKEGYSTFVIPDNVGGRYSVLTPVGLLPIAIAGYDVRKIVEGAVAMRERCMEENESNPAILYASARNTLYGIDRKVEIFVNYNPKLQYFGEWWKQLYGESEGKRGKGILPASVNFTTDLHSMGQYIQDGERIMFETNVLVKNNRYNVVIESDNENLDGLNFLAGKRIGEINAMAQLGTMLAHKEGGVPNIVIKIDRIDEYNIGELFYFFEIACGVSGYILGVNPFDQPGVEAYKKNMFALLDKPGYEEESKEIKKVLNLV